MDVGTLQTGRDLLPERQRGSEVLPSKFNVRDLLSLEAELFLHVPSQGALLGYLNLAPHAVTALGTWSLLTSGRRDGCEWKLLRSTWTVTIYASREVHFVPISQLKGRKKSHRTLLGYVTTMGLSKSKSDHGFFLQLLNSLQCFLFAFG